MRAIKLAAYPLGHVGRRYIQFPLVQFGRQGLCDCRAVGGRVDRALIPHACQNEVATPQCPFGTVDRVTGAWRLGNAGKHGKLRHGQLIQRFTVIGVRSGLRAIGAFPIRDRVDVQLEDFVFAELLLDLEREEHLFELTDEGLFQRQRDVARQLHGDGAGSRTDFPAEQQGQRVVDQGNEVDAAVFVKALVFCVEQRVNESLGHLFQSHRYGTPLPEFGQQLAFCAEDTQGGFQVDLPVTRRWWQLRVKIEINARKSENQAAYSR